MLKSLLTQSAAGAFRDCRKRALPEDERRQVIDLAELGRASLECAIACACAAPVAVGIVLVQIL